MTLTDGQLVERVRSGDRDAFGDLVGRYRDMVYGLGYHLTHDFEAARDLAQEAFVQAYLKLGQLRDPDKFPGWLRQIATNVHRAHQRRREVATVTLDEAATVPDVRHPSEIEVVVRDALGRLREPERLALTLHYINGYSHAEIGSFLGVRPETVKTRLARARQHLRKEAVAMVEDTFEKKKLPAEFTEETVTAVMYTDMNEREFIKWSLAYTIPLIASLVSDIPSDRLWVQPSPNVDPPGWILACLVNEENRVASVLRRERPGIPSRFQIFDRCPSLASSAGADQLGRLKEGDISARELLSYCKAVRARTNQYLDSIDDTDLKSIPKRPDGCQDPLREEFVKLIWMQNFVFGKLMTIAQIIAGESRKVERPDFGASDRVWDSVPG
ncbi:MAG: RNA polymerase sigma factor [Armatimonadota bacterium]|nr:MAG: RNA polymerase sigma factor [Armatimonadota bacterium]